MDTVLEEEKRVLQKKLMEATADLNSIHLLVGQDTMPPSLSARCTALERKMKDLVNQLKELSLNSGEKK